MKTGKTPMNLSETDVLDILESEGLTRFFRKLPLTLEADKCWIWKNGEAKWYGNFNICYCREQAHRISYALFVGPIPEGLLVRHRCDNPPCVNPFHLELGTHTDNRRDYLLFLKAKKKGLTRMEYENGKKKRKTKAFDRKDFQK